GGDRVAQVALRAVLRGHRRGQPALGPPARGLGQWGRGHQRHPRTVARCAEGRVQPGRTGAYDRDICVQGFHGDRYRSRMASAPVWLEHESSLRHDTGEHPERAARMRAIERELSARDWLGFERVQSPEVDRAVLEAVHPSQYVEAIERACASGGGFLDMDTVV